MVYRDFTLSKVKKAFNLQIDEQLDLFASIQAIPISDYLAFTLKENVPLAIAINTEKARSEMIISPILLEARRQANYQISLFSGAEFNVDSAQGLVGFCDFMISRSKEQLTINAPVMAIVEAKNENIKAGLGQCVAEMVAVQLFNQQEGNPTQTIYGSVTTGEIWKFLKLTDSVVSIDLSDYYMLRDVEQVLGILHHAVQEDAPLAIALPKRR
jgi:hypothetical protein